MAGQRDLVRRAGTKTRLKPVFTRAQPRPSGKRYFRSYAMGVTYF
jgi:hypothetical protein